MSRKRARTENKGILHRTGRDVEEKDFEMRLNGFNWILEGEKENFTMPEWEKNIITYLKEHGDVTPMDLISKRRQALVHKAVCYLGL